MKILHRSTGQLIPLAPKALSDTIMVHLLVTDPNGMPGPDPSRGAADPPLPRTSARRVFRTR
eukprot:6318888-Pyramimonas_sp.AAC.1